MKKIKRTILSLCALLIFVLISPVALIESLWLGLKEGRAADHPAKWISEVYADVLMTVDEALKVLLPNVDNIVTEDRTLTEEQLITLVERAHIDPHLLKNEPFRFYVGQKEGDIVGYAAHDAVPGKWGPIYYMVSFDPQGLIQDVVVLEYWEKRGRPVAKRRFTKQFKGKSVEDELQLMKDIRGITGASISSRGMTNGIRKMTHAFNLIYGKK